MLRRYSARQLEIGDIRTSDQQNAGNCRQEYPERPTVIARQMAPQRFDHCPPPTGQEFESQKE